MTRGCVSAVKAVLVPFFAMAIALCFVPQLAYAEGGDDSVLGGDSVPVVVDDPVDEGVVGGSDAQDPETQESDAQDSDAQKLDAQEPDTQELVTQDMASAVEGETVPEVPADDTDSELTVAAIAPAPANGASAPADKVADEPIQVELVMQAVPAAGLRFQVHVQNIGDQGWRTAGVGEANKGFAGTTGRSLRMESLQFVLTGGLSGSVQYQVHVQNDGWQTSRSNGGRAGTTGRSLRLEGITLALTGEVSRYYDVVYRVHVQNDGWQGWRTNGQYAGTTGRSLRLEGIEVYLREKQQAATTSADGIVGVVYRAHVQNVGNQDVKNSGEVAGTSGRSLRVEALSVWLNPGRYSGGIQYQAHVQNVGWQGWKANGAASGTTGRSLRMEAMKIELTGDIKNYYDVEYRAHVQNVGWQPWVVNGAITGTTGKGLRMEALQIRLVKKGSNQPVSNGSYVLSLAGDLNSEVAASGNGLAKAGYSTTNANGKFYLRNEAGGVTLQSVSTGKFVADTGSVSLEPWSGAQRQVWTLSWNGGHRLTNKATGKSIQLSGNSVVPGSGTGVMFNSVNILNDGTYMVKNSAKGMALGVQGSSYDSGANVNVSSPGNGGNQAFIVTNKGGNWIEMKNARSFKAVEVGYASKAEGANVRQFDVNGSYAQQWQASLNRDGSLTLVNRGSGKALTASGQGANGANVTSAANKGTAQQKWTFTASSYSLTGDRWLDGKIASIIASHPSLRSCFDYVAGFSYISGSKLGSQTIPDSTTRAWAKEMINNNGGNCYRYASLFSWLARGLGYNTSVKAGYVPSVSGGGAQHGWVEVYQNGKTYVCDPDMAHAITYRNWYMVTYADAPVSYWQ